MKRQLHVSVLDMVKKVGNVKKLKKNVKNNIILLFLNQLSYFLFLQNRELVNKQRR